MYRAPPYPLDEAQRLEALRRYRIVATEPEPQFDRIVDMAKRRFDVPIALVAFMDSGRNFLKARCNLSMSEAPRDISFCGYAILSDDVLVLKDATTDERFSENPFVVGDFNLRFYAGAPLITSFGYRVGTVCLLDTKPHQTKFPPARLQLEVTESVLLHDLDSAARRIEELHDIGVGVVLDDFGTGYSSLSYLADLPFDKIKIDRSFVKGACRNNRRHAIVRHVVALARELDMNITAEGVETEEEAILLTSAGCTSLQGYYFGRPMPACEIRERLKLKRGPSVRCISTH